MHVTQREMTYKSIGDVALQAHVFERADRETGVLTSGVVFFFGGGWQGGTPEQFFPHCRHFASRGMVAVSAEYRVADRHGTTPFECAADGKSAVRWMRSHAAELGVNPHQIVAGGGSAGGHVAACTGVIAGLDQEDEDLTVSSKPDALMLFNPVLDTTETGFGADRLGARARDLSPVHHVSKGAPPAIVFHGTADTVVPLENVERFRDEMTAAGSRCDLLAYEGEGHGFFNYGRDGGEAYKQTVRAADAFLVTLDFLSDKPLI